MKDQIRDRADRTLGQVISIGGLILIIGIALGELSTFAQFDRGWMLLCGVIIVAIAVSAFAGHALPMNVLRTVWVLIPVLSAVALVTTYLAYDGLFPEELLSWQSIAIPAVLGYLVLWLPATGAVVAAIGVCILPAISSLLVLGPAISVGLIITFNQLTGVGIVLLLITIRDGLRQFRMAEAEAEDQELRRSYAAARANEEARVARLVHDEVLATLSAALHTIGAPSRVLREGSERALDVLDSGLPSIRTDNTVSSAELSKRLRKTATDLDQRCSVDEAIESAVIPADIAETLAAAATEALRNSVWHAGANARRALRTYVDEGVVRIEVVDDGVGFDPAGVSPRRFGVQRSILAPVRALPAGSATIISAPDRGAKVVLQWVS